MSGITLKLGALLIRTLSKPIATRIKTQARENPKFRQRCISFAQSIHRVDVRLRLGLLNDPAALDRQAQRDAKDAAAKKAKAEAPTVKTEAQSQADELSGTKGKDKEADKAKKAHQPRIRPLTEAKAIEIGANFISETFIFAVGASLIFFERWYSNSKENNRRSDIADRLAELEKRDEEMKKEIEDLRTQKGPSWFWSKGSAPESRVKIEASKEQEKSKAGPEPTTTKYASNQSLMEESV